MAVPKSRNIDKNAMFVWNDTDKRYEAWDGVLNGEINMGGLSGASTNGTSALTGANTWVQVPTAAPASDYVLVVSKENADGTIRWSFENGGTPSATNGNKMSADDIIFNLNGGEVVYFGSSTDGDDVNWTTKEV